MQEDNLILGWFSRIFQLDLPYHETMDEYLDYILPKIRYLSRNLNDTDIYTDGKYWLEISDDDNAHESILHVFDPNEAPEETGGSSGESTYMYSIDGNMMKGQWARMGGGTILIKGLAYEMYDLVFLNTDFFILRKHGNHAGPKYLFLAKETKISRQYEWFDVLGRRRDQVKLEWRDIMELIFDIYRYNVFFVASSIGILVLIFIIAFFST
jgi:hypothetical protein